MRVGVETALSALIMSAAYNNNINNQPLVTDKVINYTFSATP